MLLLFSVQATDLWFRMLALRSDTTSVTGTKENNRSWQPFRMEQESLSVPWSLSRLCTRSGKTFFSFDAVSSLLSKVDWVDFYQ